VVGVAQRIDLLIDLPGVKPVGMAADAAPGGLGRAERGAELMGDREINLQEME